MPCPDHAVLLKVTAQHGRRETVGAWHGKCESDTAALCKSNGKTHSKPLAARHGKGTAWARHAMCESVFIETHQMNHFTILNTAEAALF